MCTILFLHNRAGCVTPVGGPYLDRVLSPVIGAAAGVVTGNGSQSVVIFGFSVKRRKDVDLSLTQKRAKN